MPALLLGPEGSPGKENSIQPNISNESSQNLNAKVRIFSINFMSDDIVKSTPFYVSLCTKAFKIILELNNFNLIFNHFLK